MNCDFVRIRKSLIMILLKRYVHRRSCILGCYWVIFFTLVILLLRISIFHIPFCLSVWVRTSYVNFQFSHSLTFLHNLNVSYSYYFVFLWHLTWECSYISCGKRCTVIIHSVDLFLVLIYKVFDVFYFYSKCNMVWFVDD